MFGFGRKKAVDWKDLSDSQKMAVATKIAKGVKAKETSIVTIMEMDFDDLDIDDLDEDIDTASLEEESLEDRPIQILIRPVQPLYIEQKEVSIKFDTTDELINIVPVTQLQFKDGARVRNLDGATLTRTSLVLQMQGYLSRLKGLIELDLNGELKIVVLETLIVRREHDGNSKMNASLQTS